MQGETPFNQYFSLQKILSKTTISYSTYKCERHVQLATEVLFAIVKIEKNPNDYHKELAKYMILPPRSGILGGCKRE